MPIAPAGPIAEPLDLLKTTIERSSNWQAWAGTDYQKRIHLNANRTQIEAPDGVILYINEALPTPFIVIWMPDWVSVPRRCSTNYKLTFFVQDVAEDRHSHNESANTYTTRLGGVLDDIDADFRQGVLQVLDCKEIVMSGEPTRVGVMQGQDVTNDMWTSTFMLTIGPEL